MKNTNVNVAASGARCALELLWDSEHQHCYTCHAPREPRLFHFGSVY
uniref:Uncharacterized protein n=1 Tax=Physcomitrium patens TaxID=3218 RepID=A0A2K1KPN5_PHYPA|nr:hypothetical protein PHYPA_006608 [Physcomitrium patens]PNR55715.1 hypothetical protein PHYPA_006612 [Physcomitrium patens]